jgi:predicted DNA-binding transcriptional regulator YafY
MKQVIQTPNVHFVRRAIRLGVAVSFVYCGRHRIVEPFSIGIGRGRVLLRGYERKGGVNGAEGWRVYEVDALSALVQTEESCVRELGDHPASDPAMNRVLATRRAHTGVLRFDTPAWVRKSRLRAELVRGRCQAPAELAWPVLAVGRTPAALGA